jgi:hypothetical protein
MTAMTNQLMLFTRLKPRTKWAGGRITETDAVTLEDASRLASEHAGVEITTADFLRAAARGEILLRALAPRTVTFQPSRESDKPLLMPQNSIPTLPLNACKGLANVGQAMWRNCEDFEKLDTVLGNEFYRFTRWELEENEPDLLTALDECRVTGLDIHALADAYVETQEPNTPAHAQVEGETTKQRRHRWLDLFGKGGRGAKQRVYELELRINPKADRSFICKEIEKAKQEMEGDKQGATWCAQLVKDGKRSK